MATKLSDPTRPVRDPVHEFFKQTTFLYGGNAAYIQNLQARFQTDPSSVDPRWRRFFEELSDDASSTAKLADGPSWKRPRPNVIDPDSDAMPGRGATAPSQVDSRKPEHGMSQADGLRAQREAVRAAALIRAYRTCGHLHANLDPLDLAPSRDHEELHPSTHGFSESDQDRNLFVDGAFGLEFVTLKELLEILRRTYCSTVGYEFMHISAPAQRAWLQNRIEGSERSAEPSADAKRNILKSLVEAKGYERYLDKKFVGAKRFGLDGAEATIPALEEILGRSAELGVTDVVLSMAHRGRLNVLSQVLRKPHRAIFSEFKGGSFIPGGVEGSGDVKYHLGASADRDFDGRSIHLSLAANPSHLEISDPVVLGKARAKQDQNGDRVDRTTVLPLLVHGDAAFAGQGVVAECFGLSGLAGHGTGGSLHFIINNQIGFTTDPRNSRSTLYPSDLAKTVEAPIFHVNGDDPQAVVAVARLALEFRQEFGKPVVVDMHCFRYYGHNEGDEPAFTQPVMYREIRAHESTLEIYATQLIAEGVIGEAELESLKAERTEHLNAEYEAAQSYQPNRADWLDGRWTGFKASCDAGDERTGLDVARLREIGIRISSAPDHFKLHPTVQRFVDQRGKMIESGEALDWATAEALAFGSIVDAGTPVRLSGQDSERGTFSQRHSVLIDQENGERFTPLNAIREGQAHCEIINSMLSEEAVLAFEYGYSLAEPNALVLWEAQFGDFANGAQVVFDQFISSGERKWLRMSGLVCLLPHGYDGQGPEHSSARLERYLQSSAEQNWQVANCTTPANYFHVLRRQVTRDVRKPLILMTPKSLLRHRHCRSPLADLAPGTSFQSVLRDDAETKPSSPFRLVGDDKIRRVILCSGKLYYDLLEEREKRGRPDVYLLRVEQLYPFPLAAISAQLDRFPAADIVWCQEEPKNMGAWSFIEPNLEAALSPLKGAVKRARYVGRPASAATATGQPSQHLAQFQAVMAQAFG
jgi:2-oxoglutarate dehydrogenase E1 component